MSEHPTTIKAREKLREIFQDQNFVIEEEMELPTVKNNMGEKIDPPYRADMILIKMFILELDPQSPKKGKSKGHGTKSRITHDKWRDKNIKNQLKLKDLVIPKLKIETVRFIPKDILIMSPVQIMEEIDDKLRKTREMRNIENEA